MGSASLDGAGAPREGISNDPPSAPPPISPRTPRQFVVETGYRFN